MLTATGNDETSARRGRGRSIVRAGRGIGVLTVLALLLAVAGIAGCAGSGEPIEPSKPAAVERDADGYQPPSATESRTRPQYAVRFRDRTIDLEPFLIGFPYSGHIADLEHGHLFYRKRTPEGQWLMHQTLSREGTIDHDRGRRVTDIDWSSRSFWGGEFHAPTNKLYISSDEANDEHINVYSIDLDSGAIEQITHNDYTYGWSFSEDGRYLGYLARTGLTEPFDTALRIRDMKTGADREILRDGGGDDRFTWSSVQFAPDSKSVLVTVQHDGQRNTKSIARIDLDASAPRFEFVHPDRVVRYSVSQVDGWIGDRSFLYVSAEEGFGNLYRHDLDTGDTGRLTSFQDELVGVRLLDTEPQTALVILGRPYESEMQFLDAATGRVLHKEVIPSNVSIMDVDGDQVLVSRSSLETPWRGQRMLVNRAGDRCSTDFRPFGGLSRSVEETISQYDVERVSYPTFDTQADGSPRMLHGFLLTPKNPPARREDRLVRITAFYGGSNRFDTSSQIMAAAGIATFSPSPRGCSGFGAEFSALNDGDLGGDEIVDVMYAARWLVEEKGYEPRQIGVYGGSHGGYATMRALTFPPSTNGRNASFDFGFGWSHAGFSNIINFYESCNIPDWVIKEAGDPATESEKLLDRSPISHVVRLRAPILLTHGSNDWRVPVTESRAFTARARELGKSVTYVEFEGQGHGIRGFDNLVNYYQAALTFFESLDSRNAGS